MGKARYFKEMIEIEITESVEDVDGDYMEWIIREIKRAGFSVSIDDFGVKYANLALLKNVDIDTLKLDKSMLINIGEQKKTCSLIGSMVQFCTETGIRFIVEGVETEEQFQIVQNLKCTGAQGFPVWQADAGGGIPEAAYPGINGNKRRMGSSVRLLFLCRRLLLPDACPPGDQPAEQEEDRRKDEPEQECVYQARRHPYEDLRERKKAAGRESRLRSR